MSAAPPPDVTTTTLQVWLPLVGALIGSLVGPPILEFLKDRISAFRAWKKQQHEITSTLRYVLGLLNGFYELRLLAFGSPRNDFKFNAAAADALSTYEITAIVEKAHQLAFVHPSAPDKQVLGQYLSKYLLLMHAHCNSLVALHSSLRTFQEYPQIEIEADERLALLQFDKQYRDLLIFLYAIYAKELNLESPESLIGVDRIRQLELKVMLSDLLDSHKEIDKLLSASQDFIHKTSKVTPAPPRGASI